MAWLTQTIIEQHWTANGVKQTTDDSTPPSATDSAVLTQAINAATGLVKSILRGRYPTEVDAETDSATVTYYACEILTGRLTGRRLRGVDYTIRADEAMTALRQISANEDGMSIPEWEAVSESLTIETGKIQPQRRKDIYVGWDDDYLIGTADGEHATDER